MLKKISKFVYNLRHLNMYMSELQQACNRIEMLVNENSYLREQIEKQTNILRNYDEVIKSERERIVFECEDMITRNVARSHTRLKSQLGLPARVVFLCEQPTLWNSFHTIVTEMQKDPNFEVILLRLWCKQYSTDSSYQYTAADFEEIADLVDQKFVESYDPEKGVWLNLRELYPDYVFYMRPYDYYRMEDYHIQTVSKYAKTCYVPYGMTIMGGSVEKFASPMDFCRYLHYYFLDTPLRKPFINEEYVNEMINLDEDHVLCLGYPRMDIFRDIKICENTKTDCFTILWLPRWNTSENCCHFFEYKDSLSQYAIENSPCRLILRPHPMCFANFVQTGEFTDRELSELYKLYESEPSLTLDETEDYVKAFLESNVLVADETSLIAEYYVTGKPIIFCRKETHFSALMEKLSEGVYIADNWDELLFIISFLRKGQDPLFEKRQEIIKRELLQTIISSGELIKEQIASDYFDNNCLRSMD